MAKTYNFNCVICGNEFTAGRSHAKYCSPKCKSKAKYDNYHSRSRIIKTETKKLVQKPINPYFLTRGSIYGLD